MMGRTDRNLQVFGTERSFPRDFGRSTESPKQMRGISRCWRSFQETIFCCFCCLRTKRSSVEEMMDFSALAKWKSQGQQPVMVHDILSDHIPDMREDDALEVTAMIHTVKDDGGLLNSASELCLEDESGPSDMLIKRPRDTEEQKGYSILASPESKACRTTENPANPGIKKKEPYEKEDETGQEERRHLEPSGED
ncbi:hypothetical protein JRQ81_006160 [Phrynocephalus forsythii]|uniref:Uncharacterized protein n=1 Tax=Phrynocephalus forsythii TaxID=171643 RepID=A0A9Q1AUQ4_9SAUR|nr:hypothetical protein JRQ81_006160 [Phrynocephalus forsythii]